MDSVARLALAALATSSLLSTASAAVIDLPVITDDSYSLVEVGVGTPPKNFRLLFDTGSASTWIIDSHCAENCSHINKGNRTGYDINASSTGRLTGQDAEIVYLGGNVVGPTVEDDFTADGTTFNASFIAANQSNWASMPGHGFLGLSFGSISDGGAKPIFETLMAEKLVDRPRFAIYYAESDGDSTGGVPGKSLLTLGGSHEDKYVDGELTTVGITTSTTNDYDVWRSVLHSATTVTKSNHNQSTTYTNLGAASVVFDTGAGGSISVPSGSVEALYESIGMNWTAILAGKYVPLCKDFNDWSVSFEVGFFGSTKNVTVTGSQLAIPGFANRDDACWPPFDDSGSESFALFGNNFLKNFYTIWDYSAFPHGDDFLSPSLSFGKLKKGY